MRGGLRDAGDRVARDAPETVVQLALRLVERSAFDQQAPERDLRLGAFDVLVVLVERAGALVSKEALLASAWPGLVVEENNLQVQVSALRKLLGAQAIATVPGHGYRFASAVSRTELAAANADASAHVASPPAGADSPRIYGRDDDLRVLRDMIARHPLVTIVGPANRAPPWTTR